MNQNSKKRILIFSTTYHPFVGGAEITIKEITDRLGDNFEFDLITLRFNKNLPLKEKLGNINVYRIGFSSKSPVMSDLVKFPLKLNKLFFPFIAYRKASQLHKKNCYDGVWAMMAAFAGFGAVFFKFSHPKVPYLLTLQEGDPIPEIKKKVRFAYPLFRKIFTKADIIQVISNYLGEWAKEMGGKNIEVVPNGFDSSLFFSELNEGKKQGVRNRIEMDIKSFFDDDKKILITTSRLVKKNAIDDAIKSLNFLPENINFIILGDGSDLNKLNNLVKVNELSERVWFGKSVDMKAIAKYLKISDIFIRPSLSEGFGNSFVEAMAAEIPVIATQEGGIADFLFDAKRNPNKETTGWAVDVKSPEQIAEAVKDIIASPEKTAKVVANAKKMVTEKYDWDIIAKDMKTKVFDKLLK